jgi:hypothetical protein
MTRRRRCLPSGTRAGTLLQVLEGDFPEGNIMYIAPSARTAFSRLVFGLLLCPALATAVCAQDTPKTAAPAAPATAGVPATNTPVTVRTVVVDDFERGLLDWRAFKFGPQGFAPDLEAKVDVTDKAAQVKSGKGSLYYIYNVAPKTFGLLALERPHDLAGMESIRFSLKCDAPTVFGFAAREKNGARYDTYFYCPANKWQDVAIDLADLRLSDDTKDENNRLDLDEIAAIYLADVAGLFVEAQSDQNGTRIMWLDNVEYSSSAVVPAARRTALSLPGAPVVVDDFEAGAIRWIPLLLQTQPALKIDITDSDLRLDNQAAPGESTKSLKASYTREKGNAPAWLHPVERLNLKGVASLDLALKTAQDGVFLVSLKEKDDSRYQQIIELKADDGWKQFSWPIDSFKLADDSKDENGKLDIDKVEELSLADLTGVLAAFLPEAMQKGPVGATSLWIDEVQFARANTPVK